MKRILCILTATLLACATARGQGACTPPTIVSQPADTTVAGCCPCVTFRVTAVGTAPLSYQWEKNAVPIPGATGPSLTACDLTLADNGVVFRLLVTNPCGQVYSASATLTVTPDVAPPRLLTASAECESNKLTLTFDECLDVISAEDVANYVIDGGAVLILSARLSPDGKTVCLFVDLPFAGGVHTVAVSSLLDRCGNQMDVATLPFEVHCDDCLSISKESFACVSGYPNRYTWSFILQNLSTNTIKYVFLSPVTNCFTVTPAVIALASPLAPGQSVSLNVTVDVGTNCGTNLCLLVSMHDARIALCCSELHCLNPGTLLTPPRLEIAHAPPDIVIKWDGCGVLQCTTALGAPWTDVPGASSPYVTPAIGAKKFYRLRR